MELGNVRQTALKCHIQTFCVQLVWGGAFFIDFYSVIIADAWVKPQPCMHGVENLLKGLPRQTLNII